MTSPDASREGSLSSEHEEREPSFHSIPEQCSIATLPKARTETQGSHSRPMYCYRSDSPKAANNDTPNTSFHEIVVPVDYRINHFMKEQEFPSYYTMLCLDTIAKNEYPSHYCGIRKRKTREQVKKENHSAAVIQSAWRGFQVRKEIQEMNNAAIKIQAVFRGFRIREELHFEDRLDIHSRFISICTYDNDRKHQRHEDTEKNKIGTSELKKSGSNETGYQCSTLSFNDQSSSKCLLNINDSQLREGQETDSESQISMDFSEIQDISLESSDNVKSTTNSITHGDLSIQTVSEASLNCQEDPLSVTQIQPEWNGYQVRREIQDTAYPDSENQFVYDSYNNMQSPSNDFFGTEGQQELEAAVYMETCSAFSTPSSSLALELKDSDSAQEENILSNKYSDSSISTSTKESINVNMVMNRKAPLRKPLISITVTSPNAVIHGFCRNSAMGAQGHYLIVSRSTSTISRLSVQVNVVKRD